MGFDRKKRFILLFVLQSLCWLSIFLHLLWGFYICIFENTFVRVFISTKFLIFFIVLELIMNVSCQLHDHSLFGNLISLIVGDFVNDWKLNQNLNSLAYQFIVFSFYENPEIIFTNIDVEMVRLGLITHKLNAGRTLHSDSKLERLGDDFLVCHEHTVCVLHIQTKITYCRGYRVIYTFQKVVEVVSCLF